MSALLALDSKLNGLIASLSSGARKSLANSIAKTLRDSQSKRIGAQLNPDGTAFAPRKPQLKLRGKKGRVRRIMFAKMKSSKYLKFKVQSDTALVSFIGQVQAVAKVSQFGLFDKPNRRSNKKVQYAERHLLGISQSDKAMIHDLVIAHLAK